MEGFVTVNTDASFDMKGATGGWAYWLRSDTFLFKSWGQFKDRVTDSNEAEIKAVVIALHVLQEHVSEDMTIVINCDNKLVRDIINTKRITSKFEKEGSLLLSYTSRYKKAYAKAIKGHQKSKNARQYVNNWCDENSRKYKQQN